MSVPLSTSDAVETFSFTPAANDLVSRHAIGLSSETDGLDYLMQSCTHMLQSKMGMTVSPLPPPPSSSSSYAKCSSEIALDAVGPVLEAVLANLTTEYEKRLLLKDEEYKRQQHATEAMRQRVQELEQQSQEWQHKVSAASSASAATEALRTQEREDYERLRASEKLLLCELAAKRRELEAAEAAATDAAQTASTEIQHLHDQIAYYSALEQKYRVLKDENRQLYNTIQDLRGNIRVFCRIRPQGTTGDHSERVTDVTDEGMLSVYSDKHSKWHSFKFDRVFDENSRQQEVYQEAKPLVRSVLDGFNVCIFAYGQTGSGKTYTMSGKSENEAELGLNYRALADLFEQRDERRDEVEYSVKVQLVEIYNETIRDLLLSSGDGNGNGGRTSQEHQQPLTLQANRSASGGFTLLGATEMAVSSAEEVSYVMELGVKNRTTAETKMNERSSRSHQVLTVMVEGRHLDSGVCTRGCLHLIDLAGSERLSRSGAAGQQLLEAQHINKSLSSLGCVMQALAQKREHIPFRDSKLTQLLAESLSGQAKSMMFVHIAPEASSVSETLSTLNFGKGVTEITLGAAKKNVVESGGGADGGGAEVVALREKNRHLERELAGLRAMVKELGKDEEKQRDNSAVARRRSSLVRPPQVGRLQLNALAGGDQEDIVSAVAEKENSATAAPGQLQRPLSLPHRAVVSARGILGSGSYRGSSGEHASTPSRIPTPPSARVAATKHNNSSNSKLSKDVHRGTESRSVMSGIANTTHARKTPVPAVTAEPPPQSSSRRWM